MFNVAIMEKCQQAQGERRCVWTDMAQRKGVVRGRPSIVRFTCAIFEGAFRPAGQTRDREDRREAAQAVNGAPLASLGLTKRKK